MKKNISKLLAAIIAMTLLCSVFAACNNGGDETTSAPQNEEKGIWLPYVEN